MDNESKNAKEAALQAADMAKTIEGMLGHVAEWTRRIADDKTFMNVASVDGTELDMEFRYRGAQVAIRLSAVYIPQSGRFEIAVESSTDFVTVSTEAHQYIAGVCDWIFSIAEKQAEYEKIRSNGHKTEGQKSDEER